MSDRVTANDEYALKADTSADLTAMVIWAKNHMRREPDVTLELNGRVYLRRWWVLPRNDVMNVYLHQFIGSDEPRAPHDHRGDNVSWLLENDYLEHTLSGVYHRRAGERVFRRAVEPHRVELIAGAPVISLFYIGPITRDWGFHCPKEWKHWKEFQRDGGC